MKWKQSFPSYDVITTIDFDLQIVEDTGESLIKGAVVVLEASAAILYGFLSLPAGGKTVWRPN